MSSDVLSRHQKAHVQPETTPFVAPDHDAPYAANFNPRGAQRSEDQSHNWALVEPPGGGDASTQNAPLTYTNHQKNHTESAGLAPFWAARSISDSANHNERQSPIYREGSESNGMQSGHHNSSYAEHGESTRSRSGMEASRMFLQDRQWSPDGPLSMSDELHNWFDQFDSPQAVPDQIVDENVLFSNLDTRLSQAQGTVRMRNMSESAVSVVSAVPNERFTRVEQCWPHKSGSRARVMHTLWQDMCLPLEHAGLGEVEKRNFHTRGRSSGWELDEGTRSRLEEVFGTVCHAELTNSTIGQRDATLGPNNSPGISEMRPSKTKFPPAEVLDMSLDIYFRHFHHLIPFVHVPTFTTRSTDICLLFSMCLIGLNMINTRGATAFVQKSFNVRGTHFVKPRVYCYCLEF